MLSIDLSRRNDFAGLTLAALFLYAALTLSACSKSEDSNICTPLSVRCDGEKAEICNSNGRSWDIMDCGENSRCVPGDCDEPSSCPDKCKEIVCEANQRLCGTDNLSIQECDEYGTGWRCVGTCADQGVDGVCFEGSCVLVCDPDQKSYLGCDYYAVDLDNARVPCRDGMCDAAAAQFAVVVSNPDPLLSAVVSVTTGQPTANPDSEVCDGATGAVAAVLIPPLGLEIIPLDRRDANGTVKAKLAYRVASNRPITVYQFNPLENVGVYSNDASLLLPTTSVDNEYYVMSREQTFDELKGFFTVVGISAEPTTVQITVTARTLPGEGIPALSPGETYSFTLERYEVFNIETNEIGADLTGSHIIADKPVIVFGGSEAANAPNTSRCNLETYTCEWDGETSCECTEFDPPNCNPHAKCSDFITCCADHLEQQLFPIASWGDHYLGVRSYPRNQEKDVWRVLAATENTVVTVDPAIVTIPTLGPGEYFEFETNADFILQATEPVMLGQFLAAELAPNPGQDLTTDAGIGDPAFMLAVPIRQYRQSYVFLAPDKLEHDYVSIAYKAGTTARLDSVLLESIPGVLTADIADSSWRAIRAEISDGF
ncbi:IgGFc-binding protein, partial [Myxococcota bacterium]|nr:IgGFc-binding protein [Myxococcota bacterium]